MKSLRLPRFPFARAVALALALLASPALLIDHASAATLTWNGSAGGAGDWSAANWVSGTPAAGDLLEFGGTTTPITNNNITADTNFIGINLTNNGSAGQTSNFTLSGNRITLGGNIQTTAASSSLTDTISLAMILSATRTITTNTNHNLTVSGVISGSGGLTKSGAATLTLSGANTYTGSTIVNGNGILIINTLGNYTEASSLGAATSGSIILGQTSTDGTLVYTGSGNTSNRVFQIGTNANSGTVGTITNNGTGALVFTAANFTVRQETANTATRTLNLSGSNTNNNEIQGVIQSMNSTVGSLGVTKSGTGTWILSGNNTYTGTTTISAGTLQIGSAGRLGGGSYAGAISNSGTFIYNSTNDQTLSGAITGSGALTKSNTSTLTLSNAGNNYNGTTSVSAGTLTLSGSLTTNGSVFVGSASGGVLNITGNLTQTKPAVPRNFQITNTAGQTGTVNVSGSGILNTTGFFMGDNGGGNSTFNLSGGSVTNSGETWIAGTNNTINVSGGTFNSTGTFEYGAGIANGTSTMTVNGTGTINLGSMTIGRTTSSTTTINLGDGATGGNLSLTGMTYVGGTHTINFNGGTLTANATFSMMTANTTTTVKSGGAIFNVAATRTLTVGNTLATDGTGGGLTKNGTGTLTLTAVNSYTGGTTVNAGTLNISSGASGASGVIRGTLNINANATVLAGSAWALGYQGAGSVTTININGGTLYFSGTPNSGGLAANTVNMTGGTIAGNGGGNSFDWYYGNTSTPFLNTFASSNTSTISANLNLRLNSTSNALTFNVANGTTSNGVDLLVSGNITSTGSADALGAITKNGTGRLVLSGNNTYTGNTTINAGTLEIGAAGRLGAGTYAANISNNGTLVYSGTSAQTLSGVVSGTGALTQNASSTLTLSGNNTYTGGTTINAGTLEVAGSGRLGGGSYSGNIVNSGTFLYNGTNAQTLSGVISGSGALTKNNSSTLTLSGNNTYSGATSVNAGTLALNGSLNGTLTTGSSGTVIVGSGARVASANFAAGTANATNALTVTGNLTLGGGAVATLSGGTSFTAQGANLANSSAANTLTLSGGTLTLQGTTPAVTGLNFFQITSDATSGISSSNTYTHAVDFQNSATINGVAFAGDMNQSAGGRTNSGTRAYANLATGGTPANVTGSVATLLNGFFYNGGTGYMELTGLTAGKWYDLRFYDRAWDSSVGRTYTFGYDVGSDGSIEYTTPTIDQNHPEFSPVNLTANTPWATSYVYQADSAGKIKITITTSSYHLYGLSNQLAVNNMMFNSSSTSVSATSSSVLDLGCSVGDHTLGALNLTAGASTVGLTLANGTTLTLSGDASNNAISATGTSGQSASVLSGTNAPSLIIAAGKNISVDSGVNLTVQPAISGNSAVTKIGAGTLTLTGNSTYTGATTISAGTLEVASTGLLGGGNYSGNIANSGSFLFNGTNSQTLSGVVSGSGALTKSNSGTLILSGNNTYSGATTVNGGTLQIGAGGTTGSLSTSSSIVNNGTIVFNRSDTLTQGTDFANSITGTGNLTKSGNGTLILGTNTYSGATMLNGGTLQLTGNITSSALTVGTGGIISIGNTTAAAKSNASSITLQGGSGYAFTIGNVNTSVAGTDYDQLATAGALTLSNTAANPFTIYLNGTPTGWSNTGSYSWDLISAASVTGFNSANFTWNFDNFGITSGNRTGTWDISNPSGGVIRLSYSAATPNYYWSGASGNWTTGFTPSQPITDKNLFFIGGVGGTATNNIANGTISSLNFITFNSTAGSYTLAASAGAAGASGGTALTVKGDITNYSANAQTINMDLALLGSSTGIFNTAAGNLTIGGVVSGVGSLTKQGNSTLILGANNTYSGATIISGGTLQIGAGGTSGALNANSTITNNGMLAFNRSNTITQGTDFVGVLTGAGNITQAGSGNLLLTGNNTYTGTTTISAGTLEVGAAGRLGGGAYAGNISNNGTLLYSGSNAQTLSGAISGTGALTHNNTSTLTLTGNNTYTGTTTISAGTLAIDGSGRLGGGNYTGNISNSGTFLYNGTNAQTLSGILSGNGALTKNNTSTLTLAGSNTYNGAITINAGTLQVGSTGLLGGGSYTGNIVINGASSSFLYSGTTSQTISGAVSGNGAFTMNGTGTLTFSGAKSYTGGTTVNAGTLSITAGAITGNITVNSGGRLTTANHNMFSGVGNLTVNGGTLDLSIFAQGSGPSVANFTDATITGGGGFLRGVPTYNFSGNNTWSNSYMDLLQAPTINVISGTTTLASAFAISNGNNNVTKTGNGTLVLSAANTYTSSTILNAGTLAINNATAIGNGTLTINGGTLDNTSAAAITLTNNNAQNWNGDFTFAGTRDLNMGSGNVTMNASRTITVSAGNLTAGRLIGSGYSLTKNGSGTLTVWSQGSGTWTGNTTVNSGTLHEIVQANAVGFGSPNKFINNGSTMILSQNSSVGGQFSINGLNVTMDATGGATLTLGGTGSASNIIINSGYITLRTLGGAQNVLNSAVSGYFNSQGGANQGVIFDVAAGSSPIDLLVNMNVQGNGGTITKNGTGTVSINASTTNSGNGSMAINAGTLVVSGAAQLASGTFSSNIINNGTFSYNSTSSQTISGNITGTGVITKNNIGTLTLNGSGNTYNGSTTVSGGTLHLGGNISSSALTVNSGGVISVGTSSTLTTVNKVNAASITLNGGSGYAFTIGNVTSSVAGTDYDQLTATGALTFNNTAANPFTIYLNGTPAGWSNSGNYSWTILSGASQTGFGAGNLTLDFSSFGIAGGNRTGTWVFGNPSGGNITLSYSAVTGVSWDGGSGNWTDAYSAGVRGFTASNPATDNNLYFSGAAGGTVTNNIANGTLSSVNFITFNSTAGAYTLNATTGAAGLAGGTPLTVKGDIINNANSTQTIGMNLALLSTSTGIINAANGNMSAQTSSSNITLSGNISGAGGLIKQGNGSLTLSGANTYNGTTTISSGTVYITSNTALGSTAGGTIINGGKLVLNSAGLSTSENITIDSTTNSGDIGLFANATISGLITLRNSDADIRNLSGSNTLIVTGGVTSAANRNLSFVVGGAIINTTPITIGSGVLTFMGGSNQLNVAGNTFSSLNLGWGGTLTLGVSNAITSTAGVAFGGVALAQNAFTLSLNGTNQTISSLAQNAVWAVTDGQNQNITGGGVLTVNQTTNATRSYAGRITDGTTATSLTKNGSGTLMLQNWSGINSSYSGATTINAGTLMILAGNGTSLSANSSYTVASGAVLALGGNSTVAGPSTAIIGSLAGAGTVQNGNASTAITLTAGGDNTNTTFSGVLQNGGAAALALTKNGTGTFTLSGNNSYNGTTTINAGTLEIGGAGRLGGGSYAGAITNNGSLIYSGTNNQTLSGAISGTGALTKNGSGTLTLSTVNTYTGGTTVNGGTLSLANAGADGTVRGNLTINQGAVVNANANNWSLGYGGTQNYSGNSVSAITINGGTLNFTDSSNDGGIVAATTVLTGGTISSAGNFAFLSTLTYNQTVQSLASANRSTIASGIALRMNFSPSIGNLIFDVASGTTSDGIDLQVNGGIINANTQGGGNIVKSGNGRLVFAGNNTYTGTTTINAGTIEIGASGRLGAGTYAAAITNNGTLVYSGSNAQTLSGVISGTGNLTQNASSTLTLSGNNTYTGTTTINAGTIEIGAAGRLGGGSYSGNIANSGLLIYSGTANQTLSGILSGNGALTHNNTSTLTLSGNNTYTGTTTINAGTLAIGANMSIGAFTGTGNLSLGTGYTLTTNTTTTNTFNGLVIGNGALTKNGTGWLTLGGNNTYAGATTINAGTLEIGAAGRLGGGTYSGNIASIGTFVYSGTANQILSGILSGNGTFAQNAASTLTLTGNNTYSGDTTIYAGTVEIGATGRLGGGSYAGNIANTGVLIYSGTNDQTLSGVISSVGALTQNAASTLTLTGNNTYTGTTTINAGTIQIGAAGLLGAGNHTGNIVNNGTFIYSGTNNQTLSGNISGTGALTHNAASTLTLTGSNTYNGATTVSAGTLVLNGNNSASAVTIASGATLMGSGSAGATTVSGTIAPGNSPGTLSVGALTLNSGGVYTWEMADATGAAGTGWDQIAASGLLTINSTSGATFTIAITSTGAPSNWNYLTASQSWDIITYGTISGFDATKFSVNATAFGGTLGGSSSTWAITDTGSTLRLTYTYATDAIWAGGTGNWTTGFSPAITNSVNATFTGVGGTATNNIASATLSTLGTFTFNSTAGAYTLDANSGSSGYDAASAFTLAGNIINNSNATQTINIALTSNATRVYDAAAGNITIGGSIAGNGGLTKNGSNTLTLSGNNTYSGDTTINTGTLQITSTGLLGGGNYTGNISNAGTFNYASSANQTLGGIISGNGALTKDGASNLTLTGVNTFTGATTITAGTLTIGGAGQLGSGNYSGNIANNGILAYNSSANQTLGGTISGTGDLIKNGTGTLTLSNANTYNGTTTINSGIISVSATHALGATTEVTIDGGSLLVAASDAINDSADITMGNNGTLILSGSVGEVVGQFSLTTNTTAIIDMGYTASWISFWKFTSQLSDDTRLEIWNYTVGSDHVYIRDDTNGNVAASLPNITFYSDLGGNSLGSGFFDAPEVHPHIVPEPETYATAALLLIGLAIYAYRRRRPTLERSGV